MKKTWLWMATAIGLVVIAGASVGVLADRILHRDTEAKSDRVRTGAVWFDCEEPPTPLPEVQKLQQDWRQRRIQDLQGELGLDDAQVKELRAAMERHGTRSYDFWSTTRAEYCSMRDRLRDDVRALLDEDQLPRFEARLKRLDERDRERYSRPRDGETRRSKQR